MQRRFARSCARVRVCKQGGSASWTACSSCAKGGRTRWLTTRSELFAELVGRAWRWPRPCGNRTHTRWGTYRGAVAQHTAFADRLALGQAFAPVFKMRVVLAFVRWGHHAEPAGHPVLCHERQRPRADQCCVPACRAWHRYRSGLGTVAATRSTERVGNAARRHAFHRKQRALYTSSAISACGHEPPLHKGARQVNRRPANRQHHHHLDPLEPNSRIAGTRALQHKLAAPGKIITCGT